MDESTPATTLMGVRSYDKKSLHKGFSVPHPVMLKLIITTAKNENIVFIKNHLLAQIKL